MHKILLVEDSSESYQLVKRALAHFVHLEWVQSLREAKKALDKKTFDLVLLDIQLPDGDGYRLCSTLQNDGQLKRVPVIFLTSRTSVEDKVFGFSVGGDDFITKPFDQLELKARIESFLRKRDRTKAESDILRFGDLEINKSTQRAQLFEDGKATELDLTPIELKLLMLLSKELNRAYSRDELLNSIWGENIHVYQRSVDTHISKLRKKLGSKMNYIESVHGTGYRFSIDDDARLPNTNLVAHSLII